jgi:antitoxin component YwqK of YwqJK toxin-antitoxin module
MNRVHRSETKMNDDNTYVLLNGTRYTGEVVTTAPNGVVTAVNTYVDGLEEGPQQEFHYDGTRSAAYTAKGGFAVGEALEWDDDGDLARRRTFSDTGEILQDEIID